MPSTGGQQSMLPLYALVGCAWKVEKDAALIMSFIYLQPEQTITSLASANARSWPRTRQSRQPVIPRGNSILPLDHLAPGKTLPVGQSPPFSTSLRPFTVRLCKYDCSNHTYIAEKRKVWQFHKGCRMKWHMRAHENTVARATPVAPGSRRTTGGCGAFEGLTAVIITVYFPAAQRLLHV